MALMSTLVDNFNDDNLNTSLWTSFDSSANIQQIGGKIEAQLAKSTAGINYTSIYTNTTYDLTGSYIFAEFVKLPNVNTSAQGYIKVYIDSDNGIYWIVEGGLIRAVQEVGGVFTYLKDLPFSNQDTETYRWLRIREASGVTYWDYSSNGTDWKNFYSKSNPITVTALLAEIGGGTYQSETNPGVMVFDNLNYLPVFQNKKTYLYKVYNPSGQYITTWSDVQSQPVFSQEINLPSSEMVIALNRNSDDYDEGNSVDFGNIVKVYVQDREEEAPQLLFQGRIVSYNPMYGGNEGVTVYLYSLGDELDDYIYRADGVSDQVQTVGSSTTTFSSSISIAQSFIPDQATLVYLVAKLYIITPRNVTVRIQTDSGGTPSGSTVTNGTAVNYLTNTTAQNIRFDFENTVTLTPATTYWIVVSA
jgi:hypothetical protein